MRSKTNQVKSDISQQLDSSSPRVTFTCGRSQYSWAFKIIKILTHWNGQLLCKEGIYSLGILIFNVEFNWSVLISVLDWFNHFFMWSFFFNCKRGWLVISDVRGVKGWDESYYLWTCEAYCIFLGYWTTHQDGYLWWSFTKFKSIYGRWPKGLSIFCK
jgi:hypothetical protein